MRQCEYIWRLSDVQKSVNAVRKITDQDILAEVVMNHYPYLELIAKPDWAIFEKIAERHQVREAALERITDQRLLAAIARESAVFDKVCEINRKKFRDIQHQKLSIHMIPDWEHDIQTAAVKKITDNRIFEQILRDLQYGYWVRDYALENLTDQNIIDDLAVTGDLVLRERILTYVNDVELLTKIAVKDERNGVRLNATRRLDYLKKHQ